MATFLKFYKKSKHCLKLTSKTLLIWFHILYGNFTIVLYKIIRIILIVVNNSVTFTIACIIIYDYYKLHLELLQ